MGWTTPAGYADRYRRFAEALLSVDPSIKLIANGQHPLCVVRDDDWDSTLFEADPSLVRCVTDHVLVGGTIDDASDPLDVYQDFMAVPFANESTYRDLEQTMVAAGIAEPRVAITELQLFGRLPQGHHGPSRPNATLTHDTLVDPTTMAEAIWDTLFYHSAVRLVPFVEMITHTGTVNHGGGLRKEKERVYCNPCHHAQTMFAAFGDATPVSVELEAPAQARPKVVEQLRQLHSDADRIPTVDAVAAVSTGGDLLVSLVHLGTAGPVSVSVRIENFAANRADVRTLAAEAPWAANTLNGPNAIAPATSQAAVTDAALTIELAPYSVVLLRLPPGQGH